jgi:hypothetical protein
MAEPSERDAALLLDMMLAAQDAISFIAGLDEAAFLASRLHQSAVIRELEIIGEAAGKVSIDPLARYYRDAPQADPWLCRGAAGLCLGSSDAAARAANRHAGTVGSGTSERIGAIDRLRSDLLFLRL